MPTDGKLVQQEPQLDPADSDQQHKKRRAWLAALLSIVVPGLGHLYLGQPLLAAGFFLALAFLLILGKLFFFGSFIGTVALLVLGITFQFAIIAHAAVCARKLGAITLRWYNQALVYALIIATFHLALAFKIPFPLIAHFTRYHSYHIPSGSMKNTIEIGDMIMADMWVYRSQAPQRGDVLIFRYPPDPRREFLDRCIAVGGDVVEIRDKVLYLNGEKQSEPYAINLDRYLIAADASGQMRRRDQLAPTTIPPDHYFVLGDNRDNSLDSRFWGAVSQDLLRGKALYIYWSRNKSRIGLPIDDQQPAD